MVYPKIILNVLMLMRFIVYKIIFVFCLYTTTLFAKTIPPLTIVINEDVYRDYLCVLNNQDVLMVKDYGGKCSRREVVEIILVQQMLALGGFEYQFLLEPEYYNMRERKLLEKGLLLINVDSVWQSEAIAMENYVYISPPLIRKEEYHAGFYTSATNVEVLSLNSIDQLKRLSIVSNRDWTIDWKNLTKAGFKRIVHEEQWMSQAALVKKHLIDVMLIPFSNADNLSYKIKNIELKPIPNFKFSLNESRHVLISKKHPLGEQTYKALIKGMKIMRDKGLITKAFEQSGLLNSKIKDWQRVN
jgi:hypothetical protein